MSVRRESPFGSPHLKKWAPLSFPCWNEMIGKNWFSPDNKTKTLHPRNLRPLYPVTIIYDASAPSDMDHTVCSRLYFPVSVDEN
jgi:hypothetical protein